MPTPLKSKYCKHCNKTFKRNSGHWYLTKGLVCKYNQLYLQKEQYNIGKKQAINARWRKTWSGKFNESKSKAKHRFMNWDITMEQYRALILVGCHYCGKDLKTQSGTCLDRISNQKGYSYSNVLPCCGDCNRLRGDRLTVEETEAAVKAVLALRNS